MFPRTGRTRSAISRCVRRAARTGVGFRVDNRAVHPPRMADVSREALKTVEAYASRFDALLAAGYAWINLSALGVYGEDLLVCVELPRGPVGVTVGCTSVNLSGPPLDEQTRASAWDASARIRLVE